MGRSGGSSGGGHRSSGGGHRISNSSGGHRVSSSRSSSSYSSSRSSFNRGPGYNPPPPSYHRTVYREVYYGGRPRYYNDAGYSRGETLTQMLCRVVVAILIFAVISTILGAIAEMANRPETSIQREKITGTPAFNNNCIVDETGEFRSLSRTASRLQDFYKETGVQPYIIWKDYDAALQTDADKENWALDYYDQKGLPSNTFMYVYFEEEYDNGDGYMCYVNGTQSVSVMDAEAVDIFWNYIDRYWNDDISTDDLFVKVFNTTASVIMNKPTNKWDVLRPIVICIVIVIIALAVSHVIKVKAAKRHQEIEDTERILKTPLEPVGMGSTDAKVEEAMSKYGRDT